MENKLTLYKNSLGLREISSTKDLVSCKPIRMQPETETKFLIADSISQCCDALGIELPDSQFMLLIQDIIDKYPLESIEDIQVCLKRGRSGYYGNNYGKLNMIVISEWMSHHLEDKYKEKEKELKKHKEKKEPLPEVDYEAYKARQPEEKKKDMSYETFKAHWLNNRDESTNSV